MYVEVPYEKKFTFVEMLLVCDLWILLMNTGMTRVILSQLPTTRLLAHWLTLLLVRSCPIAFPAMITLSQLALSMHLTPWPQWRLVWTTMAGQALSSSMSGVPSHCSQSQERLTRGQSRRVQRLVWPWHSSHKLSSYEVQMEGGFCFCMVEGNKLGR